MANKTISQIKVGNEIFDIAPNSSGSAENATNADKLDGQHGAYYTGYTDQKVD